VVHFHRFAGYMVNINKALLVGYLPPLLVMASGRRSRGNPGLRGAALDCFVGFASSQ